MTSDRVALHHRLAHSKWEAYARAPETKKITYGDEWVYAPDAVMMCPLFNGGADHVMADLASEEVLAAMQHYAPDGDMLTCEFRMWWKHMPDFRIVTPFDCRPAEWGFAARDTYAGTLADGTVLELHEWDYVWTNDEGQITRWDWFVDSREWHPCLDLIGLDRDSLTYQAYTVNFLREGSIVG
ncbi:hypothetical protein [Mycobacterium paraseoulense]|uniref:SnoaL-like domain-containing protein n=1 Tax=Mycobacterium paraseoulense TaxID=590652 RepID=A0A1X0IFL2_9MYCO|nr:hypothetical protein [Mycobacterium paraseoulense]MCV7396161.1 hypothetical protein [Mycobacterium paraseoulense]ORB45762.1 hypothetical protein BST39_03285 [Mycobacterium paraseoulense]BBZ70942.1 hypothetical protein MPRS_20350 [Mycobacterium paraseoulense]